MSCNRYACVKPMDAKIKEKVVWSPRIHISLWSRNFELRFCKKALSVLGIGVKYK